jgi:CMP-N-acetylneuraminic acid synthetase
VTGSAYVVAIIPVRGGDPETPQTGMLSVAGRPLLAYTIDAARASRYIQRIVVSTDDPSVAALARELGAETPFLRPSSLAARDVPLGHVLRHAINWLDAHVTPAPDLIALLEITHPVRPAGLIDKVIEVVLTENVDSAFSAREERHEFWTFDEHGELNRVRPRDETPRDVLPPLYKEMGGLITVMRPEVARAGRRLGERVGVVPVRDPSSLVDLRDDDGRRLAELLLSAPS